MFRKILLPTDGSEASQVAAEQGFRLAQYHGAIIVLVAVVESRVAFMSPAEYSPEPEIYQDRVSEAEKVLKKLQMQGQRMGLTVRMILRPGDPVAQILEVANQEKVDLIVMASHSYGRLATLLLGSVSQGVLRDAPCPVMIYGAKVWQALPTAKRATNHTAMGQVSESQDQRSPHPPGSLDQGPLPRASSERQV